MNPTATRSRTPEPPWMCESCHKARRTNYCQDCGSKRPKQVIEPSARKQDLLGAIAYFRTRQQGARNVMVTWEKDHGRPAPRRLRESSERWQRYGLACEYLLEFFP